MQAFPCKRGATPQCQKATGLASTGAHTVRGAVGVMMGFMADRPKGGPARRRSAGRTAQNRATNKIDILTLPIPVKEMLVYKCTLIRGGRGGCLLTTRPLRKQKEILIGYIYTICYIDPYRLYRYLY